MINPTFEVSCTVIVRLFQSRWVQVTPGVTLKSYTFFKPLDLSRSNG